LNRPLWRFVFALLAAAALIVGAFSTFAAPAVYATRHSPGGRFGQSPAPARQGIGDAQLAPATANLVNHGGPVQRSSVAYLIFWGASWSSGGSLTADAQIAKNYVASVGTSSYANTLTQYADSTGPIANTLTLGGVYLDTTHAIPTDASCGGATLQDAAIQSEVSAAIAAQGWPSDGANGLYVVFAPATVAVNDGSGACSEQAFCAYHNWSSSNSLAYAVVAYPTDLTACGAASAPNSNLQGDSLANLAAFAQFEVISDPRVTSGWLDSGGLGIAGKCAWNATLGSVGLANGATFAVQPMYSNASGACVKQYGAKASWLRNPGLFRPSNVTFYLSYVTPPTGLGTTFAYGLSSDIPLAGQWTSKGYDTVGVFRPSISTFYLAYTTPPTGAGGVFAFGQSGDIPVVGDWTGKGFDSIGVYRPSNATFYLRNSNSAGAPDITVAFGQSGDIPVVGDWTGQGFDTVGVFRPSTATFYLRNSNTSGSSDISFSYGVSGDVPLAGDWTGKGYDSVGVYRPAASTFYLRNGNTSGSPDITVWWGIPGDRPIVGKWR
jgi:hypothetical protein